MLRDLISNSFKLQPFKLSVVQSQISILPHEKIELGVTTTADAMHNICWKVSIDSCMYKSLRSNNKVFCLSMFSFAILFRWLQQGGDQEIQRVRSCSKTCGVQPAKTPHHVLQWQETVLSCLTHYTLLAAIPRQAMFCLLLWLPICGSFLYGIRVCSKPDMMFFKVVNCLYTLGSLFHKFAAHMEKN